MPIVKLKDLICKCLRKLDLLYKYNKQPELSINQKLDSNLAILFKLINKLYQVLISKLHLLLLLTIRINKTSLLQFISNHGLKQSKLQTFHHQLMESLIKQVEFCLKLDKIDLISFCSDYFIHLIIT